jgi:hypothetical protein
MVNIGFNECANVFLVGVASGVGLGLLFSTLGWTIYKLFKFLERS